ncbi:hypothetical protein GLYMA_02G019533v4 [Glycine max]|nr:hypothetical protein GLYMA_02G019533v4 [Glycine max]KAH1058324.1 hypothetical protein GYH30_002751 [Glycine max]
MRALYILLVLYLFWIRSQRVIFGINSERRKNASFLERRRSQEAGKFEGIWCFSSRFCVFMCN